MQGMSQKTATVIYNDTCPICSREVDSYRRYTAAQGIDVDYVGLSGDRLAEFGLSEREAARRLHLLEDGSLLRGVDAFAALWEKMPRLAWLARVVRLPGVHGLAVVVYEYVLAPLLFRWHLRRERLGKRVSAR